MQFIDLLTVLKIFKQLNIFVFTSFLIFVTHAYWYFIATWNFLVFSRNINYITAFKFESLIYLEIWCLRTKGHLMKKVWIDNTLEWVFFKYFLYNTFIYWNPWFLILSKTQNDLRFYRYFQIKVLIVKLFCFNMTVKEN